MQGYSLIDDTDLLQINDPQEIDFFGMDWDDKLDVTWGPLGRFNVYLKNGKIETTRKTDSLLDMLGSIGGVYEAQTILG